MKDLRCGNGILHGRVDIDDGVIVLETVCRSRRCGREPGVVVIHRFELPAGNLLATKRFKDPVKKGGSHGVA